MSENYGDCKLCKGQGGFKNLDNDQIEECPRCGGTGISGSEFELD